MSDLFDKVEEKGEEETLRNSIWRFILSSENASLLVLGAVVGLAGGLGAVGFRYVIGLFQTLSYGSTGELLDLVAESPWYLRILVPALGGLVVGPTVYFFAREAKGHGVPEVMEAVALKRGVIRKRVVFIKTLVSAICIGTGGSVGREGPIVQIGSAVGSTIGQLFNVSFNRMKILVGCGAAAGIAATFNAPLAGSMFAFEIVLDEFAITVFSPIIISAVTATAVSRHFLGDVPAFLVPAYKLISPWELSLYGALGFFCAFVAVSFTTLLYRVEDAFESLKFPEYLKAPLGGLLIGLMGLWLPHILGVGYGAIDLALEQQLAWQVMAVLIIYKILATSVTIGSGGSGGIFAPSLFIGSMVGGLYGAIVHSVFPGVTASSGAYSIVGMGGVVSATTHGPLSAILILFEMTGDYKIILPLMITCIISCMMARWFLTDSIYTLKLSRRGVNVRAGKDIHILSSIPVREVMNPDVETIPEGLGLDKLTEKISMSKYNSFPVVNDEGHLVGILSYADYRNAFLDEHLSDLIVAKDLATRKVVTIRADANLHEALEKITTNDFSLLPVVSGDDDSKLVGVITRRDIMNAYNTAVVRKSLSKE
ncbi:MAG: chloride channel protein [Deltaproteobacteria bacterium]|nr:chloride channel protein [Deltaproteobacteria bacterium]MBW2138650.1 chloride channel protein [Deltaproteobacteria bacterium]